MNENWSWRKNPPSFIIICIKMAIFVAVFWPYRPLVVRIWGCRNGIFFSPGSKLSFGTTFGLIGDIDFFEILSGDALDCI